MFWYIVTFLSGFCIAGLVAIKWIDSFLSLRIDRIIDSHQGDDNLEVIVIGHEKETKELVEILVGEKLEQNTNPINN